MPRHRKDGGIPCWGPMGLWRNGECEARLPNSDHSTMRKLGWGFSMGPNTDNPPESYYACPEHKDIERSRE